MKKLTFLVAVLMALSLLVACDNDVQTEKVNSDHINSLVKEMASARELAKYHSMGLEYVLNKLQSGTRSATCAPISKLTYMDEGNQKHFIETTVYEFMNTIDFVNEVSNKNVFKSSLRSAGAGIDSVNFVPGTTTLNPDLEKFLDSIFPDIEDLQTITAVIDSTVNSLATNPNLISLSEAEQTGVIMCLAVYEDSYKYWSENAIKWFESNEETRCADNNIDSGDNPDKPKGGNWWQKIKDWWNQHKDEIQFIAKQDGKEAYCGAMEEIIVAGIEGAGVGTVPNVALGAIVSAIIGSTDAAINYDGKVPPAVEPGKDHDNGTCNGDCNCDDHGGHRNGGSGDGVPHHDDRYDNK